LGISISPAIRQLRRLLYCAEWIESHVLHIYMLNAPDFFDCHSGIELAGRFPDQVNTGLQMKKIGNGLLELLGGRAIHPVNVRVGGFYRLPTREQLVGQLAGLRWALDAAIEAAHWIVGFDFPEFNIDCELVALQHPGEYPMNEGVIASTRYPAISVDQYRDHFCENHVQHSTALQSIRRDTGTPYFLGPLARLELNHDQLAGTAKQLFHDICPTPPLRNRFHSIIARIIEVVHALELAIDIIESYEPPPESFTPYQVKASVGCAATEAPRGLIYHHYEINADGTVASSQIVPPTSQNQLQIESDLRQYLPQLLSQSDEAIAVECEKLIRNYDPCISCSTHFLKLNLERT
jgi:coenzyme F420-reducing hydrogenase alpha subunit